MHQSITILVIANPRKITLKKKNQNEQKYNSIYEAVVNKRIKPKASLGC